VPSGSYKTVSQPKGLEGPVIEGESPVGEGVRSFLDSYPSSAEHVEFRVKLGGPSSKAKYSLMTDSEPVP
jgi:hypothetical protein